MNLAHLKESSPFYPVFPRGCVPIQNILVPCSGVMQNDNGNQPQEFYRVDVGLLTEEQLRTIAHMVAAQCNGTREEVLADMVEHDKSGGAVVILLFPAGTVSVAGRKRKQVR